jgi:hypothetical protein
MMSKVDDTTVGVHVQLVLGKWEAETAATSADSEPNKNKKSKMQILTSRYLYDTSGPGMNLA